MTPGFRLGRSMPSPGARNTACPVGVPGNLGTAPPRVHITKQIGFDGIRAPRGALATDGFVLAVHHAASRSLAPGVPMCGGADIARPFVGRWVPDRLAACEDAD